LISATRLGFWSATLTAVLAAVFFGVGIFGSSSTESIQYPYVLSTIRPIDYGVWIPGFLIAPILVVLIACIHFQAPANKKIFSQIGLSFALIYAGIITADYFIQLTVILPSILSNETEGLALFSMYNPHGLLVALESLGYLMMNTALLVIAAVFAGRSRVERAIRWLFVIGFVLAVGSFSVITLAGYQIVYFEIAIITINVIVLIASGALLSLFFKRIERMEKG
jgi:uncharacterized membrane protein YgdD (TMEM256/DUF423 family)